MQKYKQYTIAIAAFTILQICLLTKDALEQPLQNGQIFQNNLRYVNFSRKLNNQIKYNDKSNFTSLQLSNASKTLTQHRYINDKARISADKDSRKHDDKHLSKRGSSSESRLAKLHISHSKTKIQQAKLNPTIPVSGNNIKSSLTKQQLNSSRVSDGTKVVKRRQKSKKSSLIEQQYYQKGPTVVNRYDHQYTILPTGRGHCTKQTNVVILVHSKGVYWKERRAIRATWGGATIKQEWPNQAKPALSIHHNISLIFVTAIEKNKTWNDALYYEADAYGDILQADFIDDYHNMTLKSLLGLKYVSEFCSSASFMIKTDDDMFLNIPAILHLLFQRKEIVTERAILGPYNPHSPVHRNGKWNLTRQEFPLEYFPPYESGATYVISTDIVGELFNTSFYVPWFFVDDVYVTGVLARIIKVNHCTQCGKLFSYWGSRRASVCDIRRQAKITFTKSTPKVLYSLWQDLQKNIKC